ncbi:MAG: chemotaxis protein CheA [bacterium]|nr:chemotaxis protein CheA [bacterium]
MSNKHDSVISAVAAIADAVASLDPEEGGALSPIVALLTSAIDDIPDPASGLKALLCQSLEAMQAIEADAISDRATVLRALASALDTAAKWAVGDPDGDAESEAPLQEAGDRLAEALVQSENASQSPPGPQGTDPIHFEGQATLSEDVDDELVTEWIIECLDHIGSSEAILLSIEDNPDDPEAINTVFRAFHTIKGSSGFLELDRIQKTAHLAENLLSRARSGEIRITGGYADIVLEACDMLKIMVESVQGVAPGGEISVPDELHDLLTRLAAPEDFGIVAAACDAASESESEPVEETAKSPPERVRDIGDILIDQEQVTSDGVVRAAEQQQAGDPRHLGEILVEKEGVPPPIITRALKTQGREQAKTADSSIRVSTNRLDSLVEMVGELVIAQSMIAEDQDASATASADLAKKVSHAGKITRELQDLSMALRMVPLKGTFDKMRRVLRDLARKSGKSISFVTEGDETEIDRNMVEALGDPLIHMIRNAADHGVEASEDRCLKGKPETGTIRLSATHSSGSVMIEVRDDGEGLNHERILAKAIERKLVEPGRKLADDQIAELIFHPGFSTAKTVTDVSGRGVGMDVVKRGIETLRGSVKVSSQPGLGTTFSMSLPLTMAISDAMLVAVGDSRYLLPTAAIQQSFQPDRASLTTLLERGEMVMFRGDLIPILRLHSLFDVDSAITEPQEGLLIVVETHGSRCALLADDLLGQQQVVIKSLGRYLGHIPGVSGGAILGDARVALILDPAEVMQLAQDERAAEASPPPHGALELAST